MKLTSILAFLVINLSMTVSASELPVLQSFTTPNCSVNIEYFDNSGSPGYAVEIRESDDSNLGYSEENSFFPLDELLEQYNSGKKTLVRSNTKEIAGPLSVGQKLKLTLNSSGELVSAKITGKVMGVSIGSIECTKTSH